MSVKRLLCCTALCFVRKNFANPSSSSGLQSPLWIQKQSDYRHSACMLFARPCLCGSVWPAKEAKPRSGVARTIVKFFPGNFQFGFECLNEVWKADASKCWKCLEIYRSPRKLKAALLMLWSLKSGGAFYCHSPPLPCQVHFAGWRTIDLQDLRS